MLPLTIPFGLRLAAMLAYSCAVSVAAPADHDCSSVDVRVRGSQLSDAEAVCDGAVDALGFFAALGLVTTNSFVVEILSSIPASAGSTAVGCYLESDRRILVLSYSEFMEHKEWFKVPIDRSMYRSLVTHEVAHAVADCHFAIPNPTIQAKEYIAYVTMFATMNPVLRTRIMHAMPGKGFDSELKINAMTYLCDPMRFGIAAYLHYLDRESGTGFLFDVLGGRALIDCEPP